jgi:hypothetical protein
MLFECRSKPAYGRCLSAGASPHMEGVSKVEVVAWKIICIIHGNIYIYGLYIYIYIYVFCSQLGLLRRVFVQ